MPRHTVLVLPLEAGKGHSHLPFLERNDPKIASFGQELPFLSTMAVHFAPSAYVGTFHFLRLCSVGHSPPTINGNPLSHPSVSFIPFSFSLRVSPTRLLTIGGLCT